MIDPILFIVIYFVVILTIGFYSGLKIKTPADYYIAGKKASLFQVSSSLLATILGGSAILGTIELSQKTGWAALWFLLCASFGLVMLAPLAKYVSRYGKYTLPGLIGRFYGGKARLLSSIIIPVAWLGIIAAQIIAAAKILTSLEVISYQWSAVVAGLAFTGYTLAGGQISILKTDTVQALLIITGLLTTTIFALLLPESGEQKVLSAGALFNESFSPADLLILVLTYSVTFVAGPDIYSRIFCAKNEKTATYSVIIISLLLIPVSFMLTFLGIFSGNSGNNEILLFAGELLPSWFYGLFLAALLSAVMSSADTTLMNSSLILSELIYSDSDNKRSVIVTRIIIFIMGIMSIVIALFVTSIMQSLLISLTFFSGAFVIPVLAGLLNIKVRKNQVISAMVFGGIVALAGKLINIYYYQFIGNIVIISAFIINSFLLFIPLNKIIHKQ